MHCNNILSFCFVFAVAALINVYLNAKTNSSHVKEDASTIILPSEPTILGMICTDEDLRGVCMLIYSTEFCDPSNSVPIDEYYNDYFIAKYNMQIKSIGLHTMSSILYPVSTNSKVKIYYGIPESYFNGKSIRIY